MSKLSQRNSPFIACWTSDRCFTFPVLKYAIVCSVAAQTIPSRTYILNLTCIGNSAWEFSENWGLAQQATSTSLQDRWTSWPAFKGTSTEEGAWTSAEERTTEDIQQVAGRNTYGCCDCDSTNRTIEWRLTSCMTCRCFLLFLVGVDGHKRSFLSINIVTINRWTSISYTHATNK